MVLDPMKSTMFFCHLHLAVARCCLAVTLAIALAVDGSGGSGGSGGNEDNEVMGSGDNDMVRDNNKMAVRQWFRIMRW
jgi:hypothetical protein